MTDLHDSHLVQGVDHAAFPTFDPVDTVRFYRDVLGFPIVHSICAAGWGPEDHPDFIHFFFDIGNDDRVAFFYYFGLEKPPSLGKGDVYGRFDESTSDFFVRSRHLAIDVNSEEHLMEYRRRLDASEWPVEMQIQHETIESIYTHDPNGYMVESHPGAAAGDPAGASRREPDDRGVDGHRHRPRGRDGERWPARPR